MTKRKTSRRVYPRTYARKSYDSADKLAKREQAKRREVDIVKRPKNRGYYVVVGRKIKV